uniref:Uncharacterized protein n=1 Tax=Strix occidentalis caurina TaxID=311401 RepID=A0A8D0EIT6_STROC
VALRILAQRLGPYKRAVAYFSKQLDEVSKGWPGCLRAVAAVVIIIQEAHKFTLGLMEDDCSHFPCSNFHFGTKRWTLVIIKCG